MSQAAKLSWTAKILLALIVERTIRDDQGNVTLYWVPISKHDYVHVLHDTVLVYGGGIASALKGLAAKGFTERPKGIGRNQPYAYQATEAGIMAFEEIREELEAVGRLNNEAREVAS